MGSAQWQYVRQTGERMSDQDCVGNQKTRIDEAHTRIRWHGRESPVNWVCRTNYRAQTLVRHTAGHTARCYLPEPTDQLPVLLSFAVPYSNEFKRAIDSAILRCSSANPAFKNATEPVSSDCTPESLPRSATCS